jgi:SPP1 gp7 family putative phage head morphogenesis protein
MVNWTESETEIYEAALSAVEKQNKQLARVFIKVQKEITDELKQFFISIDPSWSKQYQAQRITELFKTFNKRLSALSGIATDEIEKAFLETYQSTFYTYAYNMCDYYAGMSGFMGFALLPFQPTNEAAIMAALTDKIGEYSFLRSMYEKRMDLQSALREEIAAAIAKGEGPLVLAKKLKDVFDSGLMRYVTTARTEMLKAYSIAQDEAVSQAQEMGIEFTYMWSSAIDGRTRTGHAKENGQYAKVKNGKPYFTVDVYRKIKGVPVLVGTASGPGPRMLTGPYAAESNINCRCRRLNIPMQIDTSQQFPMVDEKPDFNKFVESL